MLHSILHVVWAVVTSYWLIGLMAAATAVSLFFVGLAYIGVFAGKGSRFDPIWVFARLFVFFLALFLFFLTNRICANYGTDVSGVLAGVLLVAAGYVAIFHFGDGLRWIASALRRAVSTRPER